MASPAEIVRVVLANAGLVAYPGIDQRPSSDLIQCFLDLMPDAPDEVLVLADNGGRQFGRAMVGTTHKHYQIKANLRTLDHLGYDLLKAIYDYIDNMDLPTVIESRGMACNIASLYNTSEVAFLGEEVGTRRRLWHLTFGLAMQSVEQTPVEV